MEIASLDHHVMCECGCCAELFFDRVAEGERYRTDGIQAKLAAHRLANPKCDAWYKALPTLQDLCGIAPNITGGMDSAEYVRRIRNGDA